MPFVFCKLKKIITGRSNLYRCITEFNTVQCFFHLFKRKTAQNYGSRLLLLGIQHFFGKVTQTAKAVIHSSVHVQGVYKLESAKLVCVQRRPQNFLLCFYSIDAFKEFTDNCHARSTYFCDISYYLPTMTLVYAVWVWLQKLKGNGPDRDISCHDYYKCSLPCVCWFPHPIFFSLSRQKYVGITVAFLYCRFFNQLMVSYLSIPCSRFSIFRPETLLVTHPRKNIIWTTTFFNYYYYRF